MKTADIPIRIGPIYATNTVNERVDIHPPGPLVVESKGITYSGLGRVALEWLPSPTVCWSLEDYHPTTPPLWTGEVILKIPGIPNEVRARCAKANMSGGMEAKPPSVSGYVENGEGRKCDVRLKSITFHVPNFIPFIGRGIRDEDTGCTYASRAILQAFGWRIILDEIPSVSPPSDPDERDGFIISHVGQLEREDGQPFLPTDAKPLLDDLYWFLSFCRGKPTSAILPVGIDEKGEQVWSEWGSWNVSRKVSGRNWYNDFSAEGLEGVYVGFMSRCKEPLWSDSVRLAIYWYLEAGRIGSDSALILAQAAFELLAWTLLVEDRKLFQPKEFDGQDAAKKLRELLKALDIPATLATSLERLRSVASQAEFRWSDGPQALVGLRNALVHPTLKNRGKFSGVSAWVLYEASVLSLWYLELSLLHLFNYSGKYSNRLILSGFKGQEVQPVPWAAP